MRKHNQLKSKKVALEKSLENSSYLPNVFLLYMPVENCLPASLHEMLAFGL